MGKNYFEYTVPPYWELREMYLVPWKFSGELQAQVKLLFEHPKYSRFRELFTRLAKESDYNDMLKRLGGRASSVGQAIIKCFEQYVYEGPEQWYQWKKYAGLGGVQDPAFLHEENKSPSLLRPACVARA